MLHPAQTPSASIETSSGLSAAQVEARRAADGPNLLPEAARRTAFGVFLGQFKSALILVLIAAAALSAAIGNAKDALVILGVMLVNALVGFYQEYRAEESLAVLRGMLPGHARVRRDGRQQDILAADLVRGDIVLLEAGDLVPADGELLLAIGLEVDESVLTGESMPVHKAVASPARAADAGAGASGPASTLAERSDMLFMNTLLTRGRAEMRVQATGAHTEMGKLSAELAATAEAPTPLQHQLDRLGKQLSVIALSLVSMLAFLEVLRGEVWTEIVLSAIALGVAAMPEGLPVVVTVTLAIGMRNMARQRAIVKRLASVETLGCTTVICSDKTGTLTFNQMTARVLWALGRRHTVSGEGYRLEGSIEGSTDGGTALHAVLRAMVACNDSHVQQEQAVGDPMEAALLVLAHKGGVTQDAVNAALPRVAEIPFDTAHKFMATCHADDRKLRLFVKGAPDVLLPLCSRQLLEYGPVLLDDAGRAGLAAVYDAMAHEGLRGLLVAEALLPADGIDVHGDLHAQVRDLTLLGLVGLLDPPRPEARAAIADCRAAGIDVKVITGDHAETAGAIAAALGIQGRTLTGAALDGLAPAALAAQIEDVAVFARVTPSHKVAIVRALQAKGHVVAMTGDGVNDAPALKGADIGVAMGRAGTAVAKEAATMVLTDDNFATLVNAVRQGRQLYDNIVKFVRFQLSTTIGAILTVFFAPLAGLPEPFTAIQILWVALIMDGPPAVSLAMDAARPGIMAEPPRHRDEPVLPFYRLLRILMYGVTMMVGTLAITHTARAAGDADSAATLGFTTFVLFQVFNVFNARVGNGSAFNRGFFQNRMLWLSLAGVVGLQVLAVHWGPAQQIVSTTTLTPAQWLAAIAVASSVLLLDEARKLIQRMAGRA